jgi:hypothetical protein
MDSITGLFNVFAFFLVGSLVLVAVAYVVYTKWVRSGQEKGYAWLAVPFLLPFFAPSPSRAQSALGPIVAAITNSQGDIDTMKVAMIAILSVFAIVAIGFMVVRSLK